MADRLAGKRILVTQAAQPVGASPSRCSFTLPEWARQSPIARLATVDRTQPHIVPVVFCVLRGVVHIPVDGKPKSSTRLKRLRNIALNPAIALLIDEYASDWSKLRWVRVDGTAEVVATDEDVRAALESKYPQYRHIDVGDEAIRIEIHRVRSWSATGKE